MLKPVYALIGEDAFLLQQKLLGLLKQAPPDAARIDLDGERVEAAEVFDELRSFAMFGGGKIVVLRSAEAFITRFREAMENYLAHPSDSATLVLRLVSLPANQRVYKLIDKLGGIDKCALPRDLSRWIIDQAKSAHRLAVSADGARLLADLIGADLGRLDNELAKLALQVDGGQAGVEEISSSVAFQREQEMWRLTDELTAGKPAEAMKRWRQLVQMDSSAEFRAVTWLTMWLEDVGTVVSGRSLGALGWKYKGEKITQLTRIARQLGKAGHAKALHLLAEIDLQNKSGVGEAATNVERFLMSLAAAGG